MFSWKSRVLQVFWIAALVLVAGLRPGATAEYVIQPEDVLAIKVTGEPNLSKDYPVNERGDLTMELVGRVKAAGLTAKQLKEQLTTELAKYLKIFEVSVGIASENGSRVLVFGEVGKPGPTKLRPGGKLLDILAEAGQPTENADVRRIAVSRKAGGEPELVDLEAVSRDPKLNLELQPGDTVQVPSKAVNTVRVDGEVTNPGSRSLDEARTAYQAIQASSPTQKADFSRILLRRKGSDTPLTVDLTKVRTGQLKDDLKLEAGDHLTVPSRFAGFATLRGAVVNQGEKELNGTTQLWDLITGPGGGFAPGADQLRVQIVRNGQTAKTVNLLQVAKGVRRSDDPELEVRPGDLIFVPTAIATLRGETVKTGELPIGASNHILDFINGSGGGFTEKADRSNIRVIRDGKVLRTVDLAAVESGTKSYDDPELEVQPGDTIHIPNDAAQRFVIVGGVKKPGAYRIQPGMTIFDAINLGDGFSERAKRNVAVIAPAKLFDEKGNLKISEEPMDDRRRRKKKGRDDQDGDDQKGGDAKAPEIDPRDREELEEKGLIVVDLKKLEKGDVKQIVAIRPGDRIFVPEEPPGDARQRRPNLFQSILGLGAGLFGGFGF